MKRLFNIVLMVSVMAAVVPAQAVVDAPKEQVISIVKKNKTIIAALVTAALVAAAGYATGVAVSAPIVLDCTAVANAHCAGESVPWPLLEQCKDELASADWPICVAKSWWLELAPWFK